MQLREVRIDARDKEWIALLDHGDDHRGDVCYDEGLHKADLKWALENDAYLLHKGDKFNATTPDDKRYEHENVTLAYQGLNTADMVQALIEDQADFYRPFAERDRLLGFVLGNHCKTLLTRHHIDMHRQFIVQVAGKSKRGEFHPLDLGQRAIIRLKFQVTKTCVLPFFIWCWHGNSYPTLRHTRMSKLERIASNYYDIDYFTMGHVHDRFFWPNISQIGVPVRGKLQLRSKRIYYGLSGTYLKGMMEGHDGYPDKMAYPACELGGLRLLINPRTLEMREA